MFFFKSNIQYIFTYLKTVVYTPVHIYFSEFPTKPKFQSFWTVLRVGSIIVKMEKIEYQSAIKFLFLKNIAPTQVKDKLDSMLGDSAPLFIIKKFWAAEFQRDCKRWEDDERSGYPKTATTKDNIATVHQMALDDR